MASPPWPLRRSPCSSRGPWRCGSRWPERAFMAWFGPKGVATMTFSLLVLSAGVPDGGRIFDLAALVVLCSILAHGLTDHAGVAWIEARSRERSRGVRRPAAAG